MGYTHYFYRPEVLESGRFADWSRDVQTILDNLPTHTSSAGGHYQKANVLIRGPFGTGPAIVTTTQVSFNGSAHQTVDGETMYHESFSIQKVIDPGRWQRNERGWLFDCCKTARKPYDLAVTAALIRLAYYFPEATKIDSDGRVEDWEEGRALVERLFGYAAVPFTDQP